MQIWWYFISLVSWIVSWVKNRWEILRLTISKRSRHQRYIVLLKQHHCIGKRAGAARRDAPSHFVTPSPIKVYLRARCEGSLFIMLILCGGAWAVIYGRRPRAPNLRHVSNQWPVSRSPGTVDVLDASSKVNRRACDYVTFHAANYTVGIVLKKIVRRLYPCI